MCLTLSHLADQTQNIFSLKGFTVGSKCVVWSSSSNTWSKCEILEIAEEGTKVSDVEMLYLKMYLQTAKEIFTKHYQGMQLRKWLPGCSLDKMIWCENLFKQPHRRDLVRAIPGIFITLTLQTL